MRARPTVSVVIPTFERTRWLLELLQTLAGEPGDFEVLIVDDGSSDGDAKEAAVRSAMLPFQLSYYRQNHQGPGAARNLGIRKASSDVVAFLDDDTMVEPGWIRRIQEGYTDPLVAGIAGKTLTYQAVTLAERFLDHQQHLCSHQFEPDGTLAYVITANASFRKNVLEKVNGFDSRFPFPASDDMDLGFRIRRLGYRFTFNDAAVVKHRQRDSLLIMWKTFFVYGRGAYACARLHADFDFGSVASGRLFEPGKVVRVVRDYFRKLGRNFTNPDVRKSDAWLFPCLEITNHFAYQFGRLWERFFPAVDRSKPAENTLSGVP